MIEVACGEHKDEIIKKMIKHSENGKSLAYMKSSAIPTITHNGNVQKRK